jgi:hypothetical protein
MAKKFKIFVRGNNYLLQQQGESVVRKYGFYTTAFVEARNQEEAEALAMDSLKNDSKILDACQNGDSNEPSLVIESTDEITSFENCTLPHTGLILFPEEQ